MESDLVADLKVDLSTSIKTWRKLHNLRQSDLAELAGVSQPTISMMESSPRIVTMDMYFTIIYKLSGDLTFVTAIPKVQLVLQLLED